MHKFFAKTVFLGKKVTYLPECHSTNDILLDLAKNRKVTTGHVVMTDFQAKGRGQRGNSWISEPGSNLLFSILLRPEFLSPKKQFELQKVISLGVKDALNAFGLDPKIKWPNDIYIDSSKVSGILIESILAGAKIETTVVGIGLNVSQLDFSGAQATSLKKELGYELDKMDVLEAILKNIEKWYDVLEQGDYASIHRDYLTGLYWINEDRPFQSNGKSFMGIIRDVTLSGHLEVEVGAVRKQYGLKEITFQNPKG